MEFSIAKLASIGLIVLVLVLILVGGGNLLWGAAKSGLTSIDSFLGTDLFKDERDLTDLLLSMFSIYYNSKGLRWLYALITSSL